MDREKSAVKKRTIRVLLLTLALGFSCVVLYGLARVGISVPCVFYQITGLKCPGCGNTRAVLALLQGDFVSAFRLNPMFFLEAFYLAWVYGHCAFSYRQGRGFHYRSPAKWMDILILAILILWWVFRNL